MLHWHSPREDLIGVIALIVYVITCGSLSGGRNGSIFDSHTIYFFPLERSTSKSHPCVYGGKSGLKLVPQSLRESPLRIRGKSTALVFAAPTAEDHPRACREKPGMGCYPMRPPGSPPRMRGKVTADGQPKKTHRITPAHAGKSGAVWALAVPAEGSPPRMRGEGPRPGQGRAH